MATIASLDIATSVDPGGIRAGLQESLRMVQQWEQNVSAIVANAKLIPGGMTAGENEAKQLMEVLEQTYRRGAQRIAEQTARGMINPTQMRAAGIVNAAEYNAGLLSGMNELAASGKMTNMLRGSMLGNLKAEGAGASQQLRGLIAGTMMPLAASMDDVAVKGTRMGGALSRAATTAAFSIGTIAHSGIAAGGGLRSLMTAASQIGMFFGPTGLIISAIAGGIAAMLTYFAKAKEGMSDMRKKFVDDIRAMIRAGDQLGLQKRAQEVWMGDPAAGASAIASGAFQGGLKDLRTAIAGTQAQIDQAVSTGNAFVIRRLTNRLDELKTAAAPLEREYTDLFRTLANPIQMPRELTGIDGGPVVTTADHPLKDRTKDVAKEFKDFTSGITALVSSYKDLTNTEGMSLSLQQRIIAAHDQVSAALRAQGDQYGENAVKLRGLREELEKLQIIQLRMGNLGPTVGLTGAGEAGESPVANVKRAVPEVPTLQFTKTAYALATLENAVRGAAASVGTVLGDGVKELAMGLTPAGLAAAAMGGLMEGLQPVIEALQEPLRIVGEILGKALAPILKALFPIFKMVAIAATYVGEIMFKISGAILVAIGGLVRGIGKLLNKLPGSIGDPLIKAGQAMLDMGRAHQEAADELRKGRDELRDLEWGTTLDGMRNAANEAAEALRNVPIGWNAALAAFEAGRMQPAGPGAPTPPTTPRSPDGGGSGGSGGSGSGGSGGGRPGDGPQIANITVENMVLPAGTTREQAVAFLGWMREESVRQFGTSARWSEVRV